MDNSAPIVFIHIGNSWYLPYVINQALRFSSSSDVVLLSPGAGVVGATNIDIRKYDDYPAILEFKRNYRHMSPNSYEYELFCFLRWFYLLEYMREYKVERVIYLDSDCLLYSSSKDIEAWIGNNISCGLSVPLQNHESFDWCVSGHVSYWTIEMLERFCYFALRSYEDTFYLKMYEDKWANASNGGICDMTALYLFWMENKENIFNLAARNDGAVFDHNINSSSNWAKDEYATCLGTKKVMFEEGSPILLRKDSHEKVHAHAIHCQGTAKRLIPAYYRANIFEGKRWLDLNSFWEILKADAIYVIKATLRPIKRLIMHSIGAQKRSGYPHGT